MMMFVMVFVMMMLTGATLMMMVMMCHSLCSFILFRLQRYGKLFATQLQTLASRSASLRAGLPVAVMGRRSTLTMRRGHQ